MHTPVWITGLGCLCAAGQNVQHTLQGVRSGLRPQTAPNLFSDSVSGSNPVCTVRDEWMNSAGTPWRAGSAICDSLSMLQRVACEALENAGLDALPERSGFCVGTTSGCALHFLDDYAALRVQAPTTAATDLTSIENFFSHSLACSLQNNFRSNGRLPSKPTNSLTGPALTISNACTSGADAIGLGAQWIQAGLCDVVLAGGADALSLVPYIGFNRLMIYSPENCKPFDKNRQGLNLGEGSAVLVLESPEHARRRGATPLALLSAHAAFSDAHHLTAPHPQGRGLRSAIVRALNKAGLAATQLAFVNAHGTATLENDKTEAAIYADLLPLTPVWASKGVTGHCLGAAGAIEAVLTIQALRAGVVPISTGCAEPEEKLAAQVTLREQPLSAKHALSASLGFGGSNTALLFSLP